VPEDLTIEAELLAAEDTLVSYRFTVSVSGGELVSGRAVVILQAQDS
jgi:predicted hotdog family 3-hydroxylacyl-ACP dehydratase